MTVSWDRAAGGGPWVYRDEKGAPLFRVVRVRKNGVKKFFQERFDGEGFVSGMEDTRLVLYRLPEVITAVAAGEPVWIAEGEKDAERLVEAGVCGTTAPGGAGKWDARYASWLEGAEVFVCYDNDEPGWEHGWQVARSLVGCVRRWRVAAVGKDFSEHLASGGTLRSMGRRSPPLQAPGASEGYGGQGSGLEGRENGSLDPAVADALVRLRVRRDAGRLLAEEEALGSIRPLETGPVAEQILKPEVELGWTIQELHPRGHRTLLIAEAKSGKTTLTQSLGKSLVDGGLFLGRWKVEPPEGTVVYWNLEMREGEWLSWVREMGIKRLDRLHALHRMGGAPPIWTQAGEDQVVEDMLTRGAQIWIVDSWWAAFAGCGDENSNVDVRLYGNAVDRIMERASLTDYFAVVHTGRAEVERGRERARGAAALEGWADAAWFYTREGGVRALRAFGRNVDVEAVEIDMGEGRELTAGEERETGEVDRATLRLLECLAAEDGQNTTALKANMGGNEAIAQKAIIWAEASGRITRVRGSKSSLLNHITPEGRAALGALGNSTS